MILKITLLSLAMLVLAQAAPSSAPSPAPASKAAVPPVTPASQNAAANKPVAVAAANKPVEQPKQQPAPAALVPQSPTANKPAEVKPTEIKKTEEPKKDDAKKQAEQPKPQPADNKKPEEPKKDDAKKPEEQPKQQPTDNKKPDEHKKEEPHKEPENKKQETPHKPDDHQKEEAHRQGGKRRGDSDEDDSKSDEDDSKSDEDDSESDEDSSEDDDDDKVNIMSTFELEQLLKHEIHLRYQHDIERIMKFVFGLTDLKNQKEINQHLFEISPCEATLKCMAPMFERMVSSVSSCEHAADEHVKAIEIAYRKVHPEEHHRHRQEHHGERDRDHREDNHREHDRSHHDSRNHGEHDRPQYHGEHERDHRQGYHGNFDRSHHERNHEERGRPMHHGEHDRDHYEVRRHGGENHREEQHHHIQEARRDQHGIPCRNHHEDEMRMAHEIFVGQCFVNSLVATQDKGSNQTVLDETKMKQEINTTLLAKANKDKAMVDLHNCLVSPRDVTQLVQMMSGVKHFTTRMIYPMVSALYNNQQPSMSMIVQGQAKLMDIKNNLYNLKGMICLVESLAKNGCGAVQIQNGNGPQGRH